MLRKFLMTAFTFLTLAGGLILALDSLCQLASRVAELRVSVSDGEDVCPGGRTAQVGRSGVETTPQVEALLLEQQA